MLETPPFLAKIDKSNFLGTVFFASPAMKLRSISRSDRLPGMFPRILIMAYSVQDVLVALYVTFYISAFRG